MHKSAIALAFLATLSATTLAIAENDFSALLAELDFNDAPSMHQTLTPVSQPRSLSQELKTPDRSASPFSMPDLAMIESETLGSAALQPPVPQVSLQDPVSAEPPRVAEEFDLEAAFALQESKGGVQASSVAHLCDRSKEKSCDEGEVCTPYRPPMLPSSTFYQAFRSNKCNTGVWDGYRQRCRSANKHLNGTCDCFEEKQRCWQADCGEILDAPVVECAPCNAMPRHRALPIQKSCDDCTKCDTACDS